MQERSLTTICQGCKAKLGWCHGMGKRWHSQHVTSMQHMRVASIAPARTLPARGPRRRPPAHAAADTDAPARQAAPLHRLPHQPRWSVQRPGAAMHHQLRLAPLQRFCHMPWRWLQLPRSSWAAARQRRACSPRAARMQRCPRQHPQRRARSMRSRPPRCLTRCPVLRCPAPQQWWSSQYSRTAPRPRPAAAHPGTAK